MNSIKDDGNSKDDKRLLAGRKPDKIIREEPKRERKNDNTAPDEVRITRDDSLILYPSLFQHLIIFVYKNLYLIGASVLRRLRSYQRDLESLGKVLRWWVANSIKKLGTLLSRKFRDLLRAVKSPFKGIKQSWKDQKLPYLSARRQKKFPWRPIAQGLKGTFANIFKIITTLLNYLAPVAAALLLVFVIQNQLNSQLALEVVYQGEHIGYVTSEKEFNEAVKDVNSRLREGTENEFIISTPQFQLVEIGGFEKLTPIQKLADGIIRASSDNITDAYGLYADKKLVGAVLNADDITAEIDRIQTENKTGRDGERVQFQKSITFTQGLFPSDSIITENELIDIINSKETINESYFVKLDDIPESIALSNDVSLEELIASNPSMNFEAQLPIGTQLSIKKVRPFFSVKNIYTYTFDADIDFTTITHEDSTFAIGYKHIEKPGVLGKALVTADVTEVDGKVISQIILNRNIVSNPIAEVLIIGAIGDPSDDRVFKWPANGGNVGTVLGGYTGHTGVDINNTGGIGSPVYASRSGVVTKAVMGITGYGRYIEIDHGDGYTTLYAHCTDLYASVGASVSKGQQIATVGSTGNSSGPHLHFEIKYDTQVMNPVDYIGRVPQ